MAKPKKNRSSNNGNKQKGKKTKNNDDSSNSTTSIKGLFVSVVVIGVAYLWANKDTLSSLGGSRLSVFEQLVEDWPVGGAVAVQSLTEDNRGLVATRNISKGEMVLTAPYVDLEEELARKYPRLRALIEEVLADVIQEQGASFAVTTSAKILGLIRFLQLVDLEHNPKWMNYAESIPRNISTMSWYWTADERKCIVSRPDDEALLQDLNVFHATMATLKERSSVVRKIYTSKERMEWAYLMVRTRGFGTVFFIPLLDLSNHDPRKAVPTFFDTKRKKYYLMAAQDIPAGDPIYNNYGPLSPIASAEHYGFVQSVEDSAYFEVPSIHRDLWRSDYTNTNEQCTLKPVMMFGNVGEEQVVEAAMADGRAMHSTYFKSLMPTQLTNACLRVLLQSENDATMARYIAQQLALDYQRYAVMTNAPHCQSTEGNFPLIRQANDVTATLMWDAMEVAEAAAADESIPYPGIPTYVKREEAALDDLA